MIGYHSVLLFHSVLPFHSLLPFHDITRQPAVAVGRMCVSEREAICQAHQPARISLILHTRSALPFLYHTHAHTGWLTSIRT